MEQTLHPVMGLAFSASFLLTLGQHSLLTLGSYSLPPTKLVSAIAVVRCPGISALNRSPAWQGHPPTPACFWVENELVRGVSLVGTHLVSSSVLTLSLLGVYEGEWYLSITPSSAQPRKGRVS